jgi:hypothetical protein
MRKPKPELSKNAPFIPCGSCYSGYRRFIEEGVSTLRPCRCLVAYKAGREPADGASIAVDFKERACGARESEAA